MSKLKSKLRHGTSSDTDTACVYFERMEPRILFSADALAGLVAVDPFADNDSANTGMNIGASASFLTELYTPDNSSTGSQAPTDAERALQFDALRTAFGAEDTTSESADPLDTLGTLLDDAESGDEIRQEIIFVDAATPDYQQLLTGLNTDSPDTDYQIFILQSDRDGIEQITEILGGFEAVDTIHLVSHGNETGLQLGSSWLGQTSLDQYADAISGWSKALTEDADLLIYGCNLAANTSGQQLIGNLADLTTADVAASDDLTGAAALGGDWELEYSIGDVDSAVVINTTAQQSWANILATANLNAAQDSYIDINTSTSNYGSAGSLIVDRSGGNEGDQKSLLQFDLSTISAGSTINSANLVMEATATSGTFTIFVYEITQAWNESTVTWDTAPTYAGSTIATLSPAGIGPHSWDITALVEDWVDGSKSNFGIMLGSPDMGTTTFTYDSSEGTTIPQLVIDYTSQISAVDDSYATTEDTAVVVDVVSNDTGNNIGILDHTQPTDGSAVDNGDGTITYTPDLHYNGSDSFDYRIIDSRTSSFWELEGNAVDSMGNRDGVLTGTSTIAGFDGNALSFDEINDHIVVPDFAYTSDFSLSFRFTVDDISGSAFQYLYSHGTYGLPNDLNIYIGESGSAWGGILLTSLHDNNDVIDPNTLNVDINSMVGDSQWHTYTLTVQSGVGASVYIDGSLERTSSHGDDTLNPATDMYLGGRSDMNGARFYGGALDSVQLIDATLGSSEVLSLYGANISSATASITIDPVNDAPVLAAIGDKSIDELATLSFTATATDPDLPGDNLTYTLDAGSIALGMSINPTSGLFSWTPTEAQGGLTPSVTITVTDDGTGNLVDSEVITITVNEVNVAPVATNLNSTSLYSEGDVSVPITDIVITDTDTSETITATLTLANPATGSLTANDGASYNGLTGIWTLTDTVTNVNTALANLVFNPTLNNDVGTSITVNIDDGDEDSSGPLTGTITLDINGINVRAPLTDSTLEDTDLVFSSANGNEITVDDGTTGDPILRTTVTVANGTATLATTAGLSVTGDGSDTVVMIGTESDINTALDGLRYSPTANYNGPGDLKVTTDLQADLLGFYQFENSGDIGNDSSPIGTNDGAVFEATQIIDGTRGNVLQLDGIDDFITIPGRFGDPQNLTLAAWVQLDALSGGSEVISLGDRVILRLDETFSSLGVFGSFWDGSNYLTTSSGTDIAGTGWHHVAYTLDGTTNEQTLYIDGIAVDTTTHTDPVDYLGAEPDSTLGRNARTASYFFEGEMDDARIYDRALSASEIQALAVDQFSDTETVSITVDPVDDPINVNTTGNTVTFTEDAGATSALFTAGIDTIETSDTISQLVLTLANVEAGDTLSFGLTNIDLNTNGATGPDGAGFTYTVSSAGASPVVTISHTGTDDATVNTMLNSLVFNNTTNNDPGTTARTVTLTSVTDSGSGLTADGTVATVNVVPVNDAPTATPVVLAPIAEDSGVRLITQAQLLVNANDDDGDTLTAAGLTISAGSGTLVDNLDGTWNYTSALNDDSSVSFSYTISDGTAAPIAATASLDITPMNDAPSALNLTSTSTYNEGDASVAIDDIIVSDVDTAENVGVTLTLNDTTTGSLSANDGAVYNPANGEWTIFGTLSAVNNALANMVFNPNINNDQDTTISVEIDDGDEDSSAPLTGTITLDVTPINDPINVNTTGNTVTFTEDAGPTTALFSAGIDTIETGDTISQLVLNLANVEAGDTLLFGATSIDLNSNGVSGPDGAGFTYTVSSAGASPVLTISSAGVDDATVNAMLNSLVFNNTTNNDPSTSARTVTLTSVTDSGSGTTADGTVATVNVTPVNDGPSITSTAPTTATEDTLYTYTPTVVDVDDANDGTNLTWSLSGQPAGMTVSSTGVVSWIPVNGVTTSGAVTLTVQDGGEDGAVAATEIFTIAVTPVNDAPTATNLSSTSAYNEGDASVPITDIVVSDIDTGEIITATLTLADTATGSLSANDGATYTPGTGVWTITGTVAQVNTALANLVFNPTVNNEVDTSIAVNIDDGDEDGSGALTGIISLNVTPINDAPTATNLNSTSAYNEGDASAAITDIVVSDIDAGEIITATLTLADTATGSLSANDGATYTPGTGVWTITGTVAQVNTSLANLVFNPTVNNEVDTSIAVNIDDGDEDGSGALTGTINLDVTPANDPPTATNLSSTSAYNEGDVNVAITDIVVSDIDTGDTITATLTLADTATGSLSANDGATYTPGTGVWTITGTVAQVNNALANLVFNPTVNNEVDTSIAVNIDDGDEDGSGALTGTIDLNVTPVNDAPTATNLSSGTNYDASDSVVALNDIVISDVDSGETVTATLTLANVNAGSLSANNGATYNATTGVWTITGSVAQVNTALANLEFSPVANNTLNTTVAISIDDGDEDSSGPLLGAMSITVNPLPVVDPPVDPPVIESEPDDPVETPETEPPVETPDAEVVVELTKDNPLLVVGSGPVLADGSGNPAPSLLAGSVVEFIDPEARVDNSDAPPENSVAKPVGVDTLLIQLREQLEFFDDPIELIGAESFITKLNDMREALVSETENTEKVIGSSLTVTAGFSVGYVVWLARSGVLLSSVLSSLPAWRFIDPLPVLAGLQGGKGDDDEESLESMVEEKPVDDASQDAAGDDKSDA